MGLLGPTGSTTVVSVSSVNRGFTDYGCSPPLVAWGWKDRRISCMGVERYENA